MNILSPFFQLLEKRPEGVVFQSGEQRLSAADLFEQACAICDELQALGVSSGDRVGVYLPRGLDAAVVIYGILLADACYVPVDMASPAKRVQFIIQDAQCSCLVGSGDCAEWVDAQTIQYLDRSKRLPGSRNNKQISPRAGNEDIAALLYTSGSTGVPKGVAISHRAISTFCDWAGETFNLNTDDRIASLTPFHFDLSLFDLFSGPARGATTAFIPDKLTMSPARLVDWLIENKISSWYTVPSILSFIALKGGLDKKSLPELRQILFAGEVFPTPVLKGLMQKLPQTAFYNLFGPTETNVCLYWPVEASDLLSDKPIPVGMAACSAEIAIDPDSSELLVRGPCLMSGYWAEGRAELKLDASAWFHTGDKVSLNAQGQYDYHGRLDRMIKSSGYRIEPAEIEQVLNTVAGVDASLVMGLADNVGGSRLVAVVAGANLEQRSLRQEASRRLPPYMRPSFYLLLDRLPVLPNGKTDIQQITQRVQQELS